MPLTRILRPRIIPHLTPLPRTTANLTPPLLTVPLLTPPPLTPPQRKVANLTAGVENTTSQ